MYIADMSVQTCISCVDGQRVRLRDADKQKSTASWVTSGRKSELPAWHLGTHQQQQSTAMAESNMLYLTDSSLCASTLCRDNRVPRANAQA